MGLWDALLNGKMSKTSLGGGDPTHYPFIHAANASINSLSGNSTPGINPISLWMSNLDKGNHHDPHKKYTNMINNQSFAIGGVTTKSNFFNHNLGGGRPIGNTGTNTKYPGPPTNQAGTTINQLSSNSAPGLNPASLHFSNFDRGDNHSPFPNKYLENLPR